MSIIGIGTSTTVGTNRDGESAKTRRISKVYHHHGVRGKAQAPTDQRKSKTKPSPNGSKTRDRGKYWSNDRRHTPTTRRSSLTRLPTTKNQPNDRNMTILNRLRSALEAMHKQYSMGIRKKWARRRKLRQTVHVQTRQSRKLKRRPKNKLLDYLITWIGDDATEADGIRSLHITQYDDIVIGYESELKAGTTAEAGHYTIKVRHPDPIHVPWGPLTTSGLVNHRNYRIQIRNPPTNLSAIAISEAINTRYQVVDMEVENWRSPNKTESQIAYGGISIYVRCESREDAFNIPAKIEVAGHQIKIWHQGMKKCEEWGE